MIDFLINLLVQVLLYLPPFERNSSIKVCPSPIRPPFVGKGWPMAVKNGSNRNVDPYTHHWHILQRLTTIHNAANRAIGVGGLCSNIGGQIIVFGVPRAKASRKPNQCCFCLFWTLIINNKGKFVLWIVIITIWVHLPSVEFNVSLFSSQYNDYWCRKSIYCMLRNWL